MKKSISILVMLFFLHSLRVNGQSKNEIDFKVQYKPLHTYLMTVNQTSRSEVAYKGSKEFMDKLKELGKDNPEIKDKQTEMKIRVKTGPQKGDYFPLVMDSLATTDPSLSESFIKGIQMFAHCSPGDVPHLDSVSAEGMPEKFKETLVQVMQNMFSQFKYPDKKMKPGDDFTKDTPLDVPVAGMTMKGVISTTYKLVSISANTANFDIEQVYKIKTSGDDTKFKMKGGGKGRMVYDIKNNFYLLYQIDTETTTHVSVEGVDIDIKSNDGYMITIVMPQAN